MVWHENILECNIYVRASVHQWQAYVSARGHSCVHRLDVESYQVTTEIIVFFDATEEHASSTFRVEVIHPKHTHIHTWRHGVTFRKP